MKKKRKTLKENLGNFYCHLVVVDGDSSPLAMTKGMQHHRMVHINSWFVFPPLPRTATLLSVCAQRCNDFHSIFSIRLPLLLLQLKRRDFTGKRLIQLIVTTYHSQLIPPASSRAVQGPKRGNQSSAPVMEVHWQLNLT